MFIPAPNKILQAHTEVKEAKDAFGQRWPAVGFAR